MSRAETLALIALALSLLYPAHCAVDALARWAARHARARKAADAAFKAEWAVRSGCGTPNPREIHDALRRTR